MAAELIVPEILLDEIKFQTSSPPLAVVKKRLKFVARWTSSAKELVKEEIVFKAKMDPLVAKVVANTRNYFYSKRFLKRLSSLTLM